MSNNTNLVLIGSEAKDKMRVGIKLVADSVGATLGPHGKTCLFMRGKVPYVTKDGVTVASQVKSADPFVQAAVEFFLQVALSTNNLSGDGPQPLYSKVLTPTGFTTMGELKVGDEICGRGNTTQFVEGIYPKGDKEIYKVSLFDGREVECCEDHLWSVNTYYGRNKVLSVKQLLDEGLLVKKNSGTRNRFFVPKSSVEFREQPLPIDPYLMGLLLGDGSLSGSGSIELSLGRKKENVLSKIILPQGMTLNTKFVSSKNYYRVKINGKNSEGKSMAEVLESLGLLGTKSSTKFIPEIYLINSVENREALLKGLTDTDGYVNSTGLIEYSTVSEKLAQDYTFLMRSLGRGVRVNLHNRKGDSYSNTSIYRIGELLGTKEGIAITGITPTGTFTPMQCIKVSNTDHLYFTDDFVLTHNTSGATVLAKAFCDYVDANLKEDNSRKIVETLDYVNSKVLEALETKVLKISSTDLEVLRNLATISGNSLEVGEAVAEAFYNIGAEGIITLDYVNDEDTHVKISTGITLDKGWYHPEMAKSGFWVQEEPRVLIWEAGITNENDMVTFIQNMLKEQIMIDYPLVLVVDEMSDRCLATLVYNIDKANLNICVIRAPSFGEGRTHLLEDLAAASGATMFYKNKGTPLTKVTPEDLGTFKKISIARAQTLIQTNDLNETLIEAHVAKLMNEAESFSKEDREKFEKRVAQLTGKTATIFLRGENASDAAEKRDRFEDAINATRNAIKWGVVEGGGKFLLQVFEENSLDTEYREAFKCLLASSSKIAINAEMPETEYQNLLLEGGFDMAKKIKGESMFALGVIDSARSIQAAVHNAINIAKHYTQTNSIIIDKPSQ